MNLQHKEDIGRGNSSLSFNTSSRSMTKKLTKTLLNNVDDEVYRINDPEIKGLHVRLGKVDNVGVRSKVFYLFYRTRTKPVRTANFRIGNIHEVDIDTARNIALECKAKVRDWLDIQMERKKQGASNFKNDHTIASFYEEFFNNKILKERKRPEIVEASFKKDILPRAGHVALGNVTREQLHDDVFQPIATRGASSQAGKTVALMKQFFSYAVGVGRLDVNPLQGASKTLYAGKYSPRAVTPSVEVLRDSLNKLVAGGISLQNLNCFKVLSLSGVRSKAEITAKWKDIDFKNDVWNAINEKQSTKHNDIYQSVLMSPELRKVFEHQATITEHLKSEFVFPRKRDSSTASTADGNMDTKTLNRAMNRIRSKHVIELADFTPHDIRRSIRTHLISVKNVGSTGRYSTFSVACAERILGHSLGGMHRSV
ncbi:tyrosine-type recombinase/integrase [Idiomarina sp. HB]|uniref:tyrosine-type recombinase/integrase n=1 Tax=Idiomarina sp. HB TaxID=3110479 RepID=UPI003A7F7463